MKCISPFDNGSINKCLEQIDASNSNCETLPLVSVHVYCAILENVPDFTASPLPTVLP